MNYANWDYTVLTKNTNKNIKEILKTQCSENIKDFYWWLVDNHKDFAFMYRAFLMSNLLETHHFDIADELFTSKNFIFDKTIAESCAFNLSLQFNNNFFDFWNKQVKTLNQHDQSSSYKKFWHEFFSFQFLRSEEVMNHLPNLLYVIDKAPFYIDSNYDILNGYFITARKDFFKSRIKNLDNNVSAVVLQQIAILCGTHYPQFKSTFLEEFENFPDMLEIFDKTVLYQTLNHKFEQKPSGKKNKI